MASRDVCNEVVSPGGAWFMDGPMSRMMAIASCQQKKQKQCEQKLMSQPVINLESADHNRSSAKRF